MTVLPAGLRRPVSTIGRTATGFLPCSCWEFSSRLSVRQDVPVEVCGGLKPGRPPGSGVPESLRGSAGPQSNFGPFPGRAGVTLATQNGPANQGLCCFVFP